MNPGMTKRQAGAERHHYTPAVHSRPVFADPSGRRRRAMRRIGAISGLVLALCLGAVVVALAGGPAAPFAEWAAPHAPVTAAHDGTAGAPVRRSTSPSPPSSQPGRVSSPSPSAGSAP